MTDAFRILFSETGYDVDVAATVAEGNRARNREHCRHNAPRPLAPGWQWAGSTRSAARAGRFPRGDAGDDRSRRRKDAPHLSRRRVRGSPAQATPNRRSPTPHPAPPGITERRARPRAGPLLRWYYRTKYRPFAREKRARPPQRGLIMLQIDALAYSDLRRALELGLCPTIARLLREGFALRRWFCGLPSATPYCQAGMFHGENSGIPAFRFYDKAARKVITCNAPHGVQYIRDRIHSPGALAGGSSYVNLLDGDAQTVAFTVATREKISVYRRLGGTRMALLMLLHPIRMARMVLQGAFEWLLEEWERAARRARRKGYALGGNFSLHPDSEQRRRPRAADDGDSARRLSRRAGHLQHVHAVRRARAPLRPIEQAGAGRSAPHGRADRRDLADGGARGRARATIW